MAKHIPDKVWELRKDGESNGYVNTINNKLLHIYYYGDINDMNSIIDFDINRNDARLLAKRILECLEDSK